MRFRAAWLATLCLLLPLVAAHAAHAQAASAQAAGEQPPIDLEKLQADRKAREAMYPINPRISRYLGAAAKASEQGKPEEAKALLDKLNPRRLNPHERALIYRLRAYVAYANGDFEETITDFEKVLAEEVLSVETDNRIRFNIAQLHASLQQWDKVIPAMDEWFRYTQEPSPLAYYLLGISNYQLGKIDLAIANAEKAVDMSPEPVEGWLQLLAALYIQKEDFASATPILEELVIRFPKKAYWVQLSLIYGARDEFRLSLAAQQVAYLQGLLTEDKELRRLANSYLYHNLPYPAANVLEKGLADGAIVKDAKAYELLANCWIAARAYEKSLPPLQKAAEASEDGKLFVRLGQVYLQREEWDMATRELEQGIAKGGLDKPGSAYLLLGIAHYNAKRVEPARAAFMKALQHDATRAEADRWIAHLAADEQSG